MLMVVWLKMMAKSQERLVIDASSQALPGAADERSKSGFSGVSDSAFPGRNEAWLTLLH
jgi:hypothetical protein